MKPVSVAAGRFCPSAFGGVAGEKLCSKP